jgi:hypothetical protein
MNIFYLHNNPKLCAEMHCDKHVVKMIIEYAQLLSTAHRVLDGSITFEKTKANRNIKRYSLTDDRENILYKATHINHPSAIWARQSYANYVWLYNLLHYLCKEYTFRYGKIHKVEHSGLLDKLYLTPEQLDSTRGIVNFVEPPPAMPDECKIKNDSVSSYHKYYIERKVHFAKWTKREIPIWYSEGLNKQNANF